MNVISLPFRKKEEMKTEKWVPCYCCHLVTLDDGLMFIFCRREQIKDRVTKYCLQLKMKY